jgi:hypothetical protein
VTKQEIAAALAARGIVLTPAQIKKATSAALQTRLDATAPATAQPKKRKGTYAAPKGDYRPFRDGTRQAALFNLMARAEGATLDELAAAVPTWKPTTIKSAFHYDFASQHGVGVRSSFDEAGTERFHAIVPEAAA